MAARGRCARLVVPAVAFADGVVAAVRGVGVGAPVWAAKVSLVATVRSWSRCSSRSRRGRGEAVWAAAGVVHTRLAMPCVPFIAVPASSACGSAEPRRGDEWFIGCGASVRRGREAAVWAAGGMVHTRLAMPCVTSIAAPVSSACDSAEPWCGDAVW